MMRLALFMGIAFISLGGCATSQACRALRNSSTADSVTQLKCASDRGDRTATTALARLYETGAGSPVDLRRAAHLYAKAAASQPSTTAIYSPPVRNGGRGQMLFLPNPNAGLGLAEAQYRLGRMYIEGRGVERNIGRGFQLIKAAAKQGHKEAQDATNALDGE